MNLDRFQQNSWTRGQTLKAIEKASDGLAELTIELQFEGVLFQYSPNTQFIFSNPKRADGILFTQEDGGEWGITLIELKTKIKTSNWYHIKLQWHGAWLHAQAIAGVLGIRLSERVQCVVGFRSERLGASDPDPILIKQDREAQIAYREWMSNRTNLDELGEIAFIGVALDEQGYGKVEL